MGTWTSVSKLSAVLETGEQQRSTGGTYPDDEIGVVISIQPTDDGEPVAVSADDLRASTSLIDYVDESPLELKGSGDCKNWCYEKSTDLKPKDDRTPQIKYYVSHAAAPKLRTKSIGIQVKTASGKIFYSSLNGTYHSSVQISAR